MGNTFYTRQFVIFRLGSEEYGIDILRVKEIKEMMSITRVPRTAGYVRGVINLRGEVIPVIDLRRKFNLQEAKDDITTRIIIVSVDDIVIGLIVDTSSEVIEIGNEDIEEAPQAAKSIEQSYIYGIGKVGERIIILLDVMKIIYDYAV